MLDLAQSQLDFFLHIDLHIRSRYRGSLNRNMCADGDCQGCYEIRENAIDFHLDPYQTLDLMLQSCYACELCDLFHRDTVHKQCIILAVCYLCFRSMSRVRCWQTRHPSNIPFYDTYIEQSWSRFSSCAALLTSPPPFFALGTKSCQTLNPLWHHNQTTQPAPAADV